MQPDGLPSDSPTPRRQMRQLLKRWGPIDAVPSGRYGANPVYTSAAYQQGHISEPSMLPLLALERDTALRTKKICTSQNPHV